MKVTRQRKFFGAPKTMKDRSSASAKDGYFECASVEDKSFDLMRAEMETGVQVLKDFFVFLGWLILHQRIQIQFWQLGRS